MPHPQGHPPSAPPLFPHTPAAVCSMASWRKSLHRPSAPSAGMNMSYGTFPTTLVCMGKQHAFAQGAVTNVCKCNESNWNSKGRHLLFRPPIAGCIQTSTVFCKMSSNSAWKPASTQDLPLLDEGQTKYGQE